MRALAPGRSLAKASTMPNAIKVAMREEPPVEINGSGIPMTGSTPITMPMLTTAWNSTQAETAPVAI